MTGTGDLVLTDGLAAAAREGLSARQKRLPPKFFYDEVGSALFEAITLVPEYYLTRTERAILAEHAASIVARCAPGTALVELGAGSATKTRLLIREFLGRDARLLYCPIDISEEAMRAAEANVRSEFPRVTFKGVIDDWFAALQRLTRMERSEKLILFLGSSIGNLDHDEAGRFLARLRAATGPVDKLLLGTDMMKPVADLVAAYDDAAGVTAAFNRNLLRRLNRELGADFDVRAFRHEARWNTKQRRVEMHLVAERDQVVSVPGAGITVRFATGESIHTENSHKYTQEDVDALAAAGGFRVASFWRDDADTFRLNLLERA